MTSKTAWTSFVIAFLLVLHGASTASAYYNPRSGRFLSRDPIMYPDGANTYAAWYVPASVDPSGLSLYLGDRGPRCAASMLDAHSPNLSNPNWDNQAGLWGGPTTAGATGPDDIIGLIRGSSCCDMALFGHRGNTHDGRTQNPGGIVTGRPNGDGTNSSVRILPNPGVEADIGSAFRGNGCTSCRISIFACSDGGPATLSTLQSIADTTGCDVCGSMTLLVLNELHTVGELDNNGLSEPDADFNRRRCPKERPVMKCTQPWGYRPGGRSDPRAVDPPGRTWERPPTWNWVPGARLST